MEKPIQKITPHLWFNTEAEVAAAFYTDIFHNGKVLDTTYYTEAGYEIHGMKAGTVMTVEFEIEGMNFIALNGGPLFTFNPSISFFVNCPAKDEVNDLWADLSDGGTPLMPLDSYPFSERYGWIQDKYGLSWQVIYTDDISERKIFPSLLFVGEVCGKAEEAITFYTSLFDGSAIDGFSRYGPDQEPDKEGTVAYADFTITDQKFAAMDSAREHHFTFNEGISLLVRCESQKEVDYLWEQLSAVPEAEQCGWLKDKYGVSWQIVPAVLYQMLRQADNQKAERITEAILQMKKLDITLLEEASKRNE